MNIPADSSFMYEVNFVSTVSQLQPKKHTEDKTT